MATRGKVDLGKRTVRIIAIPASTKRIMTVKVRGEKKLVVKPVEKDFFEDFTTLRWVKWTTRQPEWNGMAVYMYGGGASIPVMALFMMATLPSSMVQLRMPI